MKKLILAVVMVVLGAVPWVRAQETGKHWVIQLKLTADDKLKDEVAKYLKGELEMLDGVVVVDKSVGQAPDYILDAMVVQEPLGRFVLSAAFIRPFNEKKNSDAYRKLMAGHWKGGMKDAEWDAFYDFFKPYGIVVVHELLTERKSKMQQTCQTLAEDFAKAQLGLKPEAEKTPTE